MSASPFDVFSTEPSLEVTGIIIDYGRFYFKIARAGGSNAAFAKAMRDKFAPYTRAIELGEMDTKIGDRLTAEAFAETIVLGWGYVDDAGKKHDGTILGKDGKEQIKFSVDAAKRLFADLPELFKDLLKEAQKLANFRRTDVEVAAKNS